MNYVFYHPPNYQEFRGKDGKIFQSLHTLKIRFFLELLKEVSYIFYLFFRQFNSFASFLTSTEPFQGGLRKIYFLESSSSLEESLQFDF